MATLQEDAEETNLLDATRPGPTDALRRTIMKPGNRGPGPPEDQYGSDAKRETPLP
jgi:hypothetical protein